MIVVPVSAQDLARVRWAPSPIFETLAWLRLTVDGRTHPVLGDPGPAARFALRHRDVAMVADVLRGVGGYIPDLFTPKPTPGRSIRVLQEQLSTVRETKPEVVTAQYTAGRERPGTVQRLLDSTRFTDRVANGLFLFWRSALSDNWKTIDDALSAEVQERARRVAVHGLGATLGSLNRRVGWHGDHLRVRLSCDQPGPMPHPLDLVLAPSMLGSRLNAQVTDPDNGVIAYPVQRAPDDGRQRMVGSLVGQTRAAILLGLNVPRSTTDLSRRLNLAPSTVSFHLSVLVNAGMATKARRGAVVHYVRTVHGDALADGLPG